MITQMIAVACFALAAVLAGAMRNPARCWMEDEKIREQVHRIRLKMAARANRRAGAAALRAANESREA